MKFQNGKICITVNELICIFCNQKRRKNNRWKILVTTCYKLYEMMSLKVSLFVYPNTDIWSRLSVFSVFESHLICWEDQRIICMWLKNWKNWNSSFFMCLLICLGQLGIELRTPKIKNSFSRRSKILVITICAHTITNDSMR